MNINVNDLFQALRPEDIKKNNTKTVKLSDFEEKSEMFKYKYEIDLHDLRSGATSPIDTVETDDENFTAEDYINGCEAVGSDQEWLDMLYDNEVIVYRVED